jgi:hypothetical protein
MHGDTEKDDRLEVIHAWKVTKAVARLEVIQGGKEPVNVEQKCNEIADRIRDMFDELRGGKYTEEQRRQCSKLAYELDTLAVKLGFI